MSSDPQARKALLFSIGAALSVSAMAVTGVMLDNPGEIALSDVWRSAAAMAALSIAAPALLFALGGFFRLLAYAFPLALFFVFKFAAFYFTAIAVNLHYAEAVAASAIAMGLLYLAATDPFRRRGPSKVAALMLVVFGSAAAGSAFSVGMDMTSEKKASTAALAAMEKHVPAVAAPVVSAELPDIIYIVPDRYGGADTLARAFEADVSEFSKALETRGFYVAKHARSNYPKTFESIASTFNMTDLSPLVADMGPASKDQRPIYKLLRDNAVQKTLRGMGYSYVHFGSWWEPTRFNPNADEEYYGLENFWSKLNEFEHALLRSTPLASLATYGGFVDRDECLRLKNQLDRLETVREGRKRPQFIFLHLTLPHDPITMDEGGNCIPHVYYLSGDAAWKRYRDAYAGYVKFLNRRLVEIFDSNRKIHNGRGLVFVVQADEGPYPRRLQENGNMNMFEFSDDEIRMKMGITNAVWWDAEKYGAPYLTETPINNWRIILSKISGRDIPLVENERSMLFRDDIYVYDLKDVTSSFEAPPASAVALN